MAVYIDKLMHHGWKMYGRSVKNCHMTADTEEELHMMASKIGMKLVWFQDNKSCSHYDLMESKKDLAVKFGAIYIEDTRQYFEHVWRIRDLRKNGKWYTKDLKNKKLD